MQNQPVTTHAGCRAEVWTVSCAQNIFKFGICHPGVICAVVLGQTCAAQVTSELPRTGVDNLLAGLPGVLIAGLALIFAIRERGRARKLEAALSVMSTEQAPNGPADSGAQPDAAIGVWHLDKAGNTVFQSAALRAMLAGELPAESSFSSIVRRRHGASESVACQQYRAMFFPQDTAPAREVFVIEQLFKDGTRKITIIDPTRLEAHCDEPTRSPVAA